MSRKRVILIVFGILIIISLFVAVICFSGISGNVITSSAVLSEITREVSVDKLNDEEDYAQNNFGQE